MKTAMNNRGVVFTNVTCSEQRTNERIDVEKIDDCANV